MKNAIILISSVNSGSRSGKNSVAGFIKNYCDLFFNNTEVKIEELSYPLKWICENVFGFSQCELEYKKEVPAGINIKDFCENGSPRDIMMYLGTEIFRDKFGMDIWVKRLHREFQLFKMLSEFKNKIFIVPDLRFNNEYQYFKEREENVWVINVNRSSQLNTSIHRSQTSLDLNLVDQDKFIEIENNSDLKELERNTIIAFSRIINSMIW